MHVFPCVRKGNSRRRRRGARAAGERRHDPRGGATDRPRERQPAKGVVEAPCLLYGGGQTSQSEYAMIGSPVPIGPLRRPRGGGGHFRYRRQFVSASCCFISLLLLLARRGLANHRDAVAIIRAMIGGAKMAFDPGVLKQYIFFSFLALKLLSISLSFFNFGFMTLSLTL